MGENSLFLYSQEMNLLRLTMGFWVAQTVKDLPVMQETWVWSLGQEDPLKKGMATHSSILAWKILWTEKPSGVRSMWLQRVLDTTEQLTHSHFHYLITLCSKNVMVCDLFLEICWDVLYFIFYLFIFFATPFGMWDLNSMSRDHNWPPCSGSTD